MGELRKRGTIWWFRYNVNGIRHEESSGSKLKSVAANMLKEREGDAARGLPVSAKITQLRWEEAADDLLTEYRTNKRKSVDELERRIRLHLTPFFAGRRMVGITTSDVRRFVAKRQADTIRVRRARTVRTRKGVVVTVEQHRPVSDAEINRELTTLKRAFTLAVQAGKLLHRPHIPMLIERNVRTGHFEREQFDAVIRHLPAALRPVVRFAYVTGWRIPSEVLPLQWRQVSFDEKLSPNQTVPGTVRLDPGTTKNGKARVCPMTTELRDVLIAQKTDADRLKADGVICPWVFQRSDKRGKGRQIKSLIKAFRAACIAAGCPGRIPHDFRRTAVRNLVRAGISETVSMEWTGHKTRSVFDRYDITSNGDLADAARRLDATNGTIVGQSTASPAASVSRPNHATR